MIVSVTRDEQTVIIRNVVKVIHDGQCCVVETQKGKVLKFWDDDGTKDIYINMENKEGKW